LQQWFNLSDPAVEEALYDWQSMRRFVGIDPRLRVSSRKIGAMARGCGMLSNG
jgi:IS5 family transposase